ncbi:MAG: hypothetical protein ACI97B_003929, partial [Verrucomicrobiales bacterium]
WTNYEDIQGCRRIEKIFKMLPLIGKYEMIFPMIGTVSTGRSDYRENLF